MLSSWQRTQSVPQANSYKRHAVATQSTGGVWLLTEDGHDLDCREAGHAQVLGVEGRLADQAVRALLARQPAVREAALHLQLHRLDARLLTCCEIT